MAANTRKWHTSTPMTVVTHTLVHTIKILKEHRKVVVRNHNRFPSNNRIFFTRIFN